MDVDDIDSFAPVLCSGDLESTMGLLEDDLASPQEVARRFSAPSLRYGHFVIMGSRLLCDKDVAVNCFAKFGRETQQRAFVLGLHLGDCSHNLGGFRRGAATTVR